VFHHLRCLVVYSGDVIDELGLHGDGVDSRGCRH